MPLTRRIGILLATACFLLPAGNAAAVCNATACQFSQLPASCCGATTCILDGTITVNGPSCNFDFGARNVTMSGTLNVGSSMLSIEAGSFQVTGFVNARGTSPNKGGSIVVTTNGGAMLAFGVAGSGIDLSGFGDGGGKLEVHADGPISIGGAGIDASGLASGANGGSIAIDTTAGSVAISAPVLANAALDGIGGFIDLASAHDLTVTDTGRVAAVTGTILGGEVDLTAPNGALTVATGAQILATALNNSGGDAGSINIEGGSVNIQGMVQANGGGDPTGDIGGSGGSLAVQADTGALVLMRATQGLSVDAAAGGDGGDITLVTLSPTIGDLTIGAPLSSKGAGGALGRPGGGGEIDGTSAAGMTISKTVNVAGVGGSTGLIDLFAQRNLVVNNSITGTDYSGGATLSLAAAHDVTLADPGSVAPKIRFDANGDGSGGDVSISAGNDLAIASFVLDVSGAGTGAGGSITATAGRNVTIDQKSLLNGNSTASSSNAGGHVDVEAGFPDLAGNLLLDGDITVMGHASGAVASPASVKLVGCQVTISTTGLVDSTGDRNASNLVIGRSGIAVNGNGKLKTTASAMGGQNVPSYPTTGSPPVVGPSAQVSPPFSTTCGGSCAKPVCTQKNPPAPAGCLMPCPTCGNGATTFPEDCDPPSCGGNCDIHCRRICTGPGCQPCSDNNPCTTDTCDATFGCVNANKPVGASCDNSTVCDGRETCTLLGDVEVCTADTPPDCNDHNPCTADSCNAQSGCAHGPITGPGVGGCDDRCVQTCSSGTCGAIMPPDCNDHDPTTNDSCDPTTGTCVHTPGASCMSAAQCDDGNPCTMDTCTAGACHNDPVANGISCADATKCNGDETCQNGTCQNGTAVNCSDGHFCTDDLCNPATGACSHQPVAGCCETNGDCNDSNTCTIDACVDHVCDHNINPNCCLTNDDCNDGNPCTDDSACVSNSCTHTPVTGASRPGCADDNCTTGTKCQSGACVVGTAKTCPSDNDLCTQDVCDPATGCVNHAIPGCCHNDTECNDSDVCTADSCDPDSHVCTNTLLFPGCKPCSTDTECDPKGACGNSVCDTTAGHCTSHTPPDCTDGNSRTQDLCVVDDGPNQAHCEHPCFPGVCDDHNACNGVETCSAGNCSAGTPLDCDDHDGCTDDRCDASAGCVHTQKTGFDSARCRLDAMALALQQATDGSPAVRGRLSTLVGKARQKVDAAAAAGAGKRALRSLKAAGKQLKAISNTVRTAAKRRKIGHPLADALLASAQGVSQALEALKASLTP